MVRRISKRKVILIAAALCLIGSAAAVAAGKVAGWTSHTYSNRPDFVSLKELDQAEEAMGFSIQAVEKFTNGYQFDKGFIIDVQEHDSNGTVLGSFPETSLEYRNGANWVGLSVYPAYKKTETEKHGEIVTIPYGDITLTYTKDIYKFVPPDYQVTPEEEALIEQGKLYVSYGTDAVEIREMTAISWYAGEASYLLMPYGDTPVPQEELVQMAKEIIDSK